MACIQEVKETSMKNEERKKLLPQLHALFDHQEILIDPSLDSWFINLINLFRAIIMDPHPPPELVEDLEYNARAIGSVTSRFDLSNLNIKMADDLFHQIYNTLYADGLAEEEWFEKARSIFRRWAKPSPEYYPRTGVHRYVDHLLEYLEQVVKVKVDHYDSVGPLKIPILQLQQMLQLVSGRLGEYPDQRKEDMDLKMLMEEIANSAYEIEYSIDLMISKDIPIWYSMFWLQDIRKELKGKIRKLNTGSGDMESIMKEINHRYSGGIKIIPIRLDNVINEKFDEILKAVQDRFHISSWSLVSSYKKRKKEVFLQLLSNASSHKSWTTKRIAKKKYRSDLSEDELIKLIHDLFKNKWYFIILKDVDDFEDFDDITRVLPEDNNGSLVLVTTRSPEFVAYYRSDVQKDLFITKISPDDSSTSKTKKPTTEGDMVGFKVETERMLERLTGEPKQLHIISITGMAGQGKTTFAKTLYTDFSIVDYFHTRAWCSISQVYEKKELLLELLSQVVQLSDTIRHKSDHDLAALLCKSLRGRRFLVVLDDIWSTKAWNDLRQCFPDDKNGSRIVFTTRLQDLASQAQPRSVLQPLARLSDDESWTLLHNKLYPEENECCPRELLGVGKNIAKYCKGLPLSVVLTAGLLKKMEMRQDVWNDIAESLSSRILGDTDADNKGVIDLSYKHLPGSLKPLFLYLGAFLEDREIQVQKLIRLWIAEGFINHSDPNILEQVADDCLKDLIGRSLVTVAREKSNGGVKSCRVHDLLREFALTKSKEENFLQPIHEYDEHITSSIDSLDYVLDPKFSCSSEPVIYYHRRVCIYSKKNHFFILKPFGPHVRSLLFFAASDLSQNHSYDISFLFRNFKLLRILNFEDINIGNSFEEIDVLIHLRYLAVQGTMVSIPPSISNLWNLETFSVKSLEDIVVEVPDSIWNLSKLRNLHMDGQASFELVPERLENSFVQDNLQTLSMPSLAYGDDMEKMLRKLRGIRKLKCNFLDSWDDATNCNQFPVLEFLKKLESLKVFYNGERRYPCQFHFPSNLKKLTLTNFQMPWNEISQLAILENLEVLKLLDNAFEGERWEMEDEVVFPKLKFLKLDGLNIVEWISPGDNFPYLERLILHNCKQLNEIPTSIGDIPTLLMVEVKWCSHSAAISTLEIQEMQSDVGNEEFKVIIHPKIRDLESSS